MELLGTLLQGDRRGLDLDGVDGGCVANVVAANAGIAAAHVCREEDRAVLAVVGDLGDCGKIGLGSTGDGLNVNKTFT